MESTKEDLILGYLTNQIALLPSLSKQYTQGKSTRISFLKLKYPTEKFIKFGTGERIILMPGLRGVGKTTLLFQLYENLKGVDDNIDVLYLSCDNLTKQLNSNLQETLEVYEVTRENLMDLFRSLALGITNNDLGKIEVGGF